ncbi:MULTISPECIES: hypothetical protein [unclassified Cupriavidus]|uniref:hypothetical protein n=1 Tax=unclassified Cupriavidus TaxID=2640874 RepID=UPI001365D4F3|nr:hypothetical protein [Cupriavidus sp. SW-Y-13]MWL90321.1 hypothetical protein [Cupriavidus sp. SW-Y-13]
MPALSRHTACRLLLAPAAIALAAACANIEGGTMSRIFDSWKGAPIDQAKAQWGPPKSVQNVSGGTAYIWNDEVPLAHAPGYGPRDAGLEPPQRFGQCQRKLIAGPDGHVSRGEWSGDACCTQSLIGQCARLARKPASTG